MPQLQSKSKDKSLARATKEKQKASSKPARSTNIGSGNSASAYNPISGTFHTLEVSSVASSPENGQFRNIDETEEHSSGRYDTVSEYDSVSNHDSCSGESEDPKEKVVITTSRQEAIPGSDNDRREKIRLKNEKKHQRHRERRAQELHERCNGYLMSRKLETLSQQLVAMGFSSERATLALLLNEGRVEESVSWLFDKNEEEAHKTDVTLGSGCNLKIDISEELGQVSALEESYKCSKQEVEKTIVACEGDLQKAEDTLRTQKQEHLATLSNLDEAADSKNHNRPQEKPIPMPSIIIQQRKNERDLNFSKPAVTVSPYSEPGSRELQSLKPSQPKFLLEKRWTTTGSSPPVSVPSHMRVAPQSLRVEARNGGLENEGKLVKQVVVNEPVIMMQRPQSINAKHNPVSSISSSSLGTPGWYSNDKATVENIRSNGVLLNNQSTGSLNSENPSGFYHQTPYKEIPYMFNPMDSPSVGLGGSLSKLSASSPPVRVASETRVPSATVTVPSPPGLFFGWNSAGTLGSSTHVDWSTGGSMPICDYMNIDWALDANTGSSKSNGLWLGLSSMIRKNSGMRQGSVNGVCLSGLHDGMAAETSSAHSYEWTSPFAGKDIFSAPRQFVTSPSP